MSDLRGLRVSAIVVSYNTRDLLIECVESLIPQVYEVIVIDNASSDGSAEAVAQRFPDVLVIRNLRNRGFGAANNQGLNAMTGDLALLLNSDARAEEGAVDHLVRTLTNDAKAVGCGGMLLSPDGALQNSSANTLTLWVVVCEQFLLEKLFPKSRLLNPYWNTHHLSRGPEPKRTAQVMGACMLFRPKEWFDERFFLYAEDTDLCDRLTRHGYFLYVPEARFTHALGASSESNRAWSVAMYNRGKELYFLARGKWLSAALCWALNRLGALLRLIIWCVTLRPAKVRLFAAVLFAPIRGPRLPADARE